MQLRKLIEEYLNSSKILQVATSKNNQSWTCTLYFACDEKLNLYWISLPSRRHSQELKDNSKVSGTIVLPHSPGDKVRGIQFQGTAKELISKSDLIQGLKHYGHRYQMKKDRIESIVENKDGHRCYKITPSLYVLFDEVNFPDSPRQEYSP